MKVIFLDIDGVLNSRSRWQECKEVKPKDSTARFDPLAMWRMKQLVTTTGAKIVISSSWRHIFPIQEIAGFLWRYGIPREAVIGKTARIGRRGHEIRNWLNKYPVENYVIIDDDPDAGSGGVDRSRVVKTDWETGFLADHMFQAQNLLGKKIQL